MIAVRHLLAILLLPFVAAVVAKLLNFAPESRKASLGFRIVLGKAHQNSNAADPLGLLRVRRDRPRGTRTAREA